MDLKEQIITEYLTQGGGFRKLASKYGISRTTICGNTGSSDCEKTLQLLNKQFFKVAVKLIATHLVGHKKHRPFCL